MARLRKFQEAPENDVKNIYWLWVFQFFFSSKSHGVAFYVLMSSCPAFLLVVFSLSWQQAASSRIAALAREQKKISKCSIPPNMTSVSSQGALNSLSNRFGGKIPVRIFFLDNSSKMFLVGAGCTVQALLRLILEKLEITDPDRVLTNYGMNFC